jgi:multidrug efflux pump subunit AcrB
MDFVTEQQFVERGRKALRGRRGAHSGAVPSQERQGQIKHLWEKHHKMLRLTLIGWDQRDIATELGCTVATVRNCVNSALGKRILQEMQAAVDSKTVDVAAKLQEMSRAAAEKLSELMEDPDTPKSLQARIAMDNLDRTGHARQINVKGNFMHGVLTAEDIERLKRDAYSCDIVDLDVYVSNAHLQSVNHLPMVDGNGNGNSNGNGGDDAGVA